MSYTLHLYVLHKTLPWLFLSPRPYIPKSLAQSTKALSGTTHLTVSFLNGPEHSHWAHLPVHPQVSLFMRSGPWRVLLTTCNILPTLTLDCLANTPVPHSELISDTSFPWMPFLTIRGRGNPTTVWTQLQNTSHRSIILFFLFPLFPVCLSLVYSISPLIPSYTKFLIMNAMKTTNQKIIKHESQY